MVYQWFVFVLIAGVAIFSTMANQIYEVNSFGQREKRYSWISAMLIAIPLIYLAGTRDNMNGWGDTFAYRSSFKNLPDTIFLLKDYITDDTKDKGFTIISIIIKSIIGNRDVVFFLIIATVCILCVVSTYRKYSCDFVMSMFLFVASSDYLQWNYNGIRQFIPVAILFSCLNLFLKKKNFLLVAIILVLSTIHATALLMIPIIYIAQGKPWNKKTILFIILAIIAIVYVESFTDLVTDVMENTQYSGEVNQYLNTSGTNYLRVLVYAIPTILAFGFKKYINYANNPLINLAVNMSLISFGVYLVSAFTSGLFIGRIPIYFSLYNYILLPWELENIFSEDSQKMLKIIIIVFYLLFYYYQVCITWGL